MRRSIGQSEKLAHPERFELPTDRFVADYSIQLSYGCRTAGPFYQKNTCPEIFDCRRRPWPPASPDGLEGAAPGHDGKEAVA